MPALVAESKLTATCFVSPGFKVSDVGLTVKPAKGVVCVKPLPVKSVLSVYISAAFATLVTVTVIVFWEPDTTKP